MDRPRTGLEAFGDLMIEVSGDVGEVAEKLSPIRKILDAIAHVIHGTREEAAEQKRLPPPTERKRIEPPKNKSFSRDLDDEIPF